MLSISRDDDIALVRLDRGVTNPIDLELVNALDAALSELGEDPAVRGVVLGSANDKFLSIGTEGSPGWSRYCGGTRLQSRCSCGCVWPRLDGSTGPSTV